jgi:hypothetical protein
MDNVSKKQELMYNNLQKQHQNTTSDEAESNQLTQPSDQNLDAPPSKQIQQSWYKLQLENQISMSVMR